MVKLLLSSNISMRVFPSFCFSAISFCTDSLISSMVLYFIFHEFTINHFSSSVFDFVVRNVKALFKSGIL